MDKWKKDAIRLLVVRRKQLGMGQVDAANRAGVTQPFWSMVESGVAAPGYESLRRMCKAVGLRWEDARCCDARRCKTSPSTRL